tara:strand:+ start:2989 stop:6231 length:3243 start_codon:yes stop_codon:yes gene_type:complete
MIKIQLLDYKYRENSSGFSQNNLINFNNVTTLPANCKIVDVSKITWSSLGVNSYIYPVAGNLTDGSQYELEVTISDYSGSGDIGFATALTDTTVDIPADARRGSNGTTIGSAFTCSTSTGAPKLLCEANTSGSIIAKLVRRNTILEDSSIKGVLDVGDSEDFPLALSFSVADIRNLNARTGTYSKTFKIPATKNNNIILKSSYHPGATIDGNKITGKKPCTINIDDMYSIEGLLEISAVGQADNPLYYSCVFYGNNVGWSALIENELLKDLRVASYVSLITGEIVQGAPGSGWDNLNGKGANTGVGLKILHGATDQYAATASNTGTVPVPPVVGIVDTWDVDNALESTPYAGATVTNTSPVVYPNVGYGIRNAGGTCVTQQLLMTSTTHDGTNSAKTGCLGWNGSYNAYGNPTPSCDWRPGIFIYDIIKQIFAQVGYSVSSTFIETDMFKKLIMLLPNFKYNNSDDRRYDYSASGRFDEAGAPIGLIENVTSIKYGVEPYSANPSANASWPGFNLDFDNSGNYVELDDYSNSIYSGNNGFFVIEEAGFYDISSANIGMNVDTLYPTGATTYKILLHYMHLRLQINTVGESTWNNIVNVDSGVSGGYYNSSPAPPNTATLRATFPNIEITRYLNKGDRVKWQMKAKISHNDTGPQDIGIQANIWGGNPISLWNNVGFSDASARIGVVLQPEVAAWGQTYDLKNVIDSESTQMDFLKGVIHAFNLYLTTDVTNKVVTMEPFFYGGDDTTLKAAITNFFYNQNEALDWTSKVDLSQVQEDKYVETKLSAELIFKYQSDSKDKKVEQRALLFWDGVMDEFPWKEYVGGDSKVGVTTYENPFFAGSYNQQDGTIGGDPYCSPGDCFHVPYSALLWGTCDTTPPTLPTACSGCRPAKGYDFKPRLLNYVKDGYDVSPVGSSTSEWWTAVQTWGTSTQEIHAGKPTLHPSPNDIKYPVLTRAMSHDKFADLTNPPPVLTYGSSRNARWNYLSPTASYALRWDKGLYQTYYQPMINMLKKSTRIKEAYVNLKLADIQLLDLRKLVCIHGYYYRINKIIDFKPNNNELTKVELVLWEEPSNTPAAPSYF